MIQSTSKEAYDKIVEKLGNKQYQVYKALLSIEPACNKRIALELNVPVNEITGRIAELRYKGVVEEAYKAEYDGYKAIHWQTINPAMRKFEKDNPMKALFGEDPLDSFPTLSLAEEEKAHREAESWLNDPIEIPVRK